MNEKIFLNLFGFFSQVIEYITDINTVAIGISGLIWFLPIFIYSHYR
jgi:hypothetical protein